MRAALLLVALVLTGCAGPTADVNRETEWTLTSASDAAGEILLDDTHPVTLSLSTPQGGTAACNRYGVTIDGSSGAITVRGVNQTEMACSPASVMEIESRYLAALQDSTEMSFDDKLTLTGPDTILTFTPAG